jgi:hypothetical protein
VALETLSVRNAPADPDFVVITSPELAAAAAGLAVPSADEAAADELLRLHELQVAVGRAVPSATASPTPRRAAPGVRNPTDALIVTVPVCSRLPAFDMCRHNHYDRSGEAA